MKQILSSFVLFSLVGLVVSAQDAGLKPIFNGTDLSGWKYELAACWQAGNGVLHAVNDPDQKGDILSTKKSYKNFLVQADFKFGEGRVDTGIFLRGNREQIQIGESGSLKRDMTALPYVPGKGYPVQVETAQEVLEKNGWNTLKVRVVGNSYTTWLNGREIMTYDSETIPSAGPIGLQVHPGRIMSVDFRNILVKELPE